MNLNATYRPKKWEDVIGQPLVTTILQKQLDAGEIQNAYLFAGPSGSGKTTCARILESELNKGAGLPIEIDAASHSGVDHIRLVIEDAKKFSLHGAYKVYIIDECQRLSGSAWDALLKMLEEMPKTTIFIFCTTNAEKVPNTIKSRVQKFNFRQVSPIELEEYLLDICDWDKITFDTASLNCIGRAAKGNIREALSILETCAIATNKNLDISTVTSICNCASPTNYFNLFSAFVVRDLDFIIRTIDYYYASGLNLTVFMQDFLENLIDFTKTVVTGQSQNNSASLVSDLLDYTVDEYLQVIDIISKSSIQVNSGSTYYYYIMQLFMLYCKQ